MAYSPARTAVEAAPTTAVQNHVLILIFGILSICVIFLFGPFAWVMGKRELAKIDRGELPRDGRGMAQAGMICGIVGTGIGALWLLMVAWMLSTFPMWG